MRLLREILQYVSPCLVFEDIQSLVEAYHDLPTLGCLVGGGIKTRGWLESYHFTQPSSQPFQASCEDSEDSSGSGLDVFDTFSASLFSIPINGFWTSESERFV